MTTPTSLPSLREVVTGAYQAFGRHRIPPLGLGVCPCCVSEQITNELLMFDIGGVDVDPACRRVFAERLATPGFERMAATRDSGMRVTFPQMVDAVFDPLTR